MSKRLVALGLAVALALGAPGLPAWQAAAQVVRAPIAAPAINAGG